MQLGAKLRKIRKEKSITLKELSDRSNLSLGYLSNLERDISSPTFDNMQKLCEIFEISITSLLQEEQSVIIKKTERKTIFEEENIIFQDVNFNNRILNGLCITIYPDYTHNQTWQHPSDEIGIILSGEMIIVIDNKEYHVKKGDSFYIKAQKKHSLKSISQKPCESYWVKYNPS